MATTQTKNANPDLDAALEQIKELGDQFLATARTAGTLYVDAYETAVDRVIELELRAAGLAQQEWLKGLIETQADFTRELAAGYTTAARSILK